MQLPYNPILPQGVNIVKNYFNHSKSFIPVYVHNKYPHLSQTKKPKFHFAMIILFIPLLLFLSLPIGLFLEYRKNLKNIEKLE